MAKFLALAISIVAIGCSAVVVAGGAAAANGPDVICATCGEEGYPPPVPCNRSSGDFVTSWQGHTWFCFGGTWYYGG